MYGITAHIQCLTQVQLLAAALIADLIHVTAAAKQAVAALQATAATDTGLTGEALEQLARLPAWPACLLPLLPPVVASKRCCESSSGELAETQSADTNARVHHMLLAALGDLEAVWADAQLKEVLLALPLPAMQLLLSSDELCVTSEDTALYTATRYMLNKTDWEARAAAQAALAPLIRCPQLSRFALMWTTLAGDRSKLLLGEHEAPLRQLLSLRCMADACSSTATTSSSGSGRSRGGGCSSDGNGSMLCSSSEGSSMMQVNSAAAVAAAAADIADAPPSWRLSQRLILPRASGACVMWRLPVESLAQACRDSVATQQEVTLEGADSPPVGGVAWRIRIMCEPVGAEQSVIGAYAEIVEPDDIFYAGHITLSCKQGVHGGAGGGGVRHEFTTPLLPSAVGFGDDDFFGLEAMAGGGWDEGAWAARGLPTAGVLELEMVVHSVC